MTSPATPASRSCCSGGTPVSRPAPCGIPAEFADLASGPPRDPLRHAWIRRVAGRRRAVRRPPRPDRCARRAGRHVGNGGGRLRGGRIAIDAAFDAPDRIAALVTVGSTPSGQHEGTPSDREREMIAAMEEAGESGAYEQARRTRGRVLGSRTDARYRRRRPGVPGSRDRTERRGGALGLRRTGSAGSSRRPWHDCMGSTTSRRWSWWATTTRPFARRIRPAHGGSARGRVPLPRLGAPAERRAPGEVHRAPARVPRGERVVTFAG